MDILHHLRNPGMMIPSSVPANNGVPWFPSGVGFRPPTVFRARELTFLLQGIRRLAPGHRLAGRGFVAGRWGSWPQRGAKARTKPPQGVDSDNANRQQSASELLSQPFKHALTLTTILEDGCGSKPSYLFLGHPPFVWSILKGDVGGRRAPGL